jgi:hypothetical protein
MGPGAILHWLRFPFPRRGSVRCAEIIFLCVGRNHSLFCLWRMISARGERAESERRGSRTASCDVFLILWNGLGTLEWSERDAAVFVGRLGFQDDFGVTFDPLVEFLIGHGSLIEGDFIGDNEAGFGSAGNDHVTQVGIVLFHVTLASSQA